MSGSATGPARRLAVIGNPVAHSRSPEIHAAFARASGLSISYEKLLAPLDGFEATARDFVARGGIGFNVTVPFKGDAARLVDELSPAARAGEAVNTVTVRPDGRLAGDSTDGGGLVTDISANLGWRLSSSRVLIVGAGGAARAVLPALMDTHPAAIHVRNRTHEKAVGLAERFGGPVAAVTEAGLEDDYDVIINASSAGLAGDSGALPERIVGTGTRCYDMVYGSGTTPFCRWAKASGCRQASDGLGMLVEQAALAFDIWFDYKPKTGDVITLLRGSL